MQAKILDMELWDSTLFTYVLLPLLIFVARIFDVTIGTLRIIFLSKGKKLLVPIFGFFEVLIWIIAIGKIMQNADSWISYVAYAGGFAAGNYIGLVIEEKLAMGTVVLRIIAQRSAHELAASLREKGFGITLVDAQGATGNVNILFTTIQRSDIKNVVSVINEYNPSAFYSIEDVRYVNQGVFPVRKIGKGHRKGK